MSTLMNRFKRGGKSLLSLVVSVSFAISLTPAAAFAQAENELSEAATFAQTSNPPNALVETSSVETAVTASGWWDSSADTSWYSDSLSTFTLKTAEQLAGLASLVNSGNSFTGKTIRLGADIDLSAHYWVPIGGNRGISGNTPTGTAFNGTFDGGHTASNGTISQYTVSGLTIVWDVGNVVYGNQAVSSTTSYAAFGLFGYASGTLQNISVTGSIKSNARVYEVGGVVGTTSGNVYNCSSAVAIDLTGIYSARSGGIVGEALNTVEGVSNQIQYCVNTGTLNVVRFGGGIVGSVDATYDGGVNINNCYNLGDITDTAVGDAVQVGGIAGGSNGYINNCYSIGKITMSNTSSDVGGIVGKLLDENATVGWSYANADFTGSASMDSLRPAIGYIGNNECSISNVLWVANNGTTQPVASGSNGWGIWTLSGPTSISLLVGGAGTGNPTVYTTTSSGSTSSNDYSVMYILGSGYYRNTGDYPRLNWQSSGLAYGDFGIGSGTQEDPFRITGQADLEAINEALAGNNGFSGKYFKITKSFTLDAGWNGLGYIDVQQALTNSPYPGSDSVGFAGILDGNNQTITISRSVTDVSGQGGLINYLAPTGQISNLTVQGTFVITYTQTPDCTSTVDGISAFGGVVGYNCGIIDKVTNKVTITNGTVSGANSDVVEIYNVGGIAGFNDAFYQVGAIGTIRNCINDANITGYEKVGGITGENAGLIASCLNSINSTITPTSTRRSGAGGIAGRNGNNNTAEEVGTIYSCANYGNVYSGVAGNNQDALDTQSSWVGGIAGWLNSKSTINYSYNYGNVRGYGYTGYIAGGTGYENSDGKTNYNGGIYYCYTRTDSTGATTTGKQLGVNGAQLAGGALGNLNGGISAYGSFYKHSLYSTPYPMFDATSAAVANPAAGWQKTEQTVYLDPSASADGDGTLTSPYKTLDAALSGVGMGKIVVMGSVEIASRTTIWSSVDFERYTGGNFTGPMFIIDAPDDPEFDSDDPTTYVTFESEHIDGKGVGTLFQVNQGRLRLRGGTSLTNAAQGVVVDATKTGDAEVELEQVYIDTQQAVYVSSNSTDAQHNGIFYTSAGKYSVKLLSNVYLGSNVYIQVNGAITCPFTYECADPSVGRVVLQGTGGRELKSTDTSNVKYVGDAVSLQLSGASSNNSATMQNVYIAYVNGTHTTSGTGSEEDPYNTLEAAYASTCNAKLIMINGTTALAGGTYTGKTIQSGAATLGTMFTYSQMGVDASFDGVTIIGTEPGSILDSTTVFNVQGGNLILDSATIIERCGTAVDINDGSCTVKNTRVDASQYSFKVENSAAHLNFNMTNATAISGTVYLGGSSIGAYFYISAPLTCNLVVECANADADYVIAVGSGYTITQSDAEKVTYLDSAFGVELGEGGLILSY